MRLSDSENANGFWEDADGRQLDCQLRMLKRLVEGFGPHSFPEVIKPGPGGYAMNIRKHLGPGQGHELLKVEAFLLFHQSE